MPSSKKRRTSKDIGTEFERDLADKVGGQTVLASGALWFQKMDVKDAKILWSAKATANKSFSLKQADIREVVDAVEGPGGVGLDVIPAMAIRIGSPEYDMVVLRHEDFQKLAEGEVKYIEPTKHEAKRIRSKVPQLFREEDE